MANFHDGIIPECDLSLNYIHSKTLLNIIQRRENLLNKLINWFDENYSHGPHVDVDYMIRSSEVGFNVSIFGTTSYSHGDTKEEEELRKTEVLPDRLVMNNTVNEEYFKSKWKSSWEGWHNRVHPPTHISQVTRNFNDIDFHPGYLRKYNDV